MNTETSKPAFPKATPDGDQLQKGMTLREYYIGCAMQGYIASMAGNGSDPDPKTVAINSIGYADALLTELAKPTP